MNLKSSPWFVLVAALLVAVAIFATPTVRESSVLSYQNMWQGAAFWSNVWRRFTTVRVPVVRLGELCRGENNCHDFCKNNFGQCQKYCGQHPENKLCQKPFKFQLAPAENWPRVEIKKQIIPVTTKVVPVATKTELPTVPPEKRGCQGSGPVHFSSPPLRLEEIETIIPLGQMYGSHVTPTDHGYYHAMGWSPQQGSDPATFKDILSPADGIVGDVGHMPGAKEGVDYRFSIYHTCTFYTVYIHVWELSPKLSQALGNSSYKVVSVPVKAGEVIGRASAFDFSVHNEEVKLKGFVIPEHYDAESWKIHTVDLFDSFIEPIRSQLLSKNIRQAEPRSGKIDYDIDGKLVGTWFREGTAGYRGGGYGGAEPYWASHLTLAYNNLDPSLIMVSVGDLEGQSRQFAVRGNAPDPAEISVDKGLVKYELMDYDFLTEQGQSWNRRNFAKITKAVGTGPVRGVVLVQMTGDRKIKFEGFLGKTAEEVTGFTSQAKIYER